jgi:hypothetical protein
MSFHHALLDQAVQQAASTAFGWLLGSLAATLRRRLAVVMRRPLTPEEPTHPSCPAVSCACAASAAEYRPRP